MNRLITIAWLLVGSAIMAGAMAVMWVDWAWRRIRGHPKSQA